MSKMDFQYGVGFDQRKQEVVKGLAENDGDKSRKGSVDWPIVRLVDLVNKNGDIFTTSSCSGRVSVFGEPSAVSKLNKQKGGEWIYVTHDEPDVKEITKAIKERFKQGIEGRVVFRFEPFILAAECRNLEAAAKLVQIGRDAGFRESGITLGNQRIIVGLRSSNKIELPIIDSDKMLVSEEYLEYIVNMAKDKFALNLTRISKLETSFLATFVEGGSQNEVVEYAVNGGRVLEAEEKLVIGSSSMAQELGISGNGNNERELMWRILEGGFQEGLSPDALKRWGHCCCRVDEKIIVFGGYGGGSAHGRLNDFLVFNIKSNTWEAPQITGTIPEPCMGHAAAAVGDRMVIVGGRKSPAAALDHVHVLDTSHWSCEKVNAKGSGPCVFRHSACAFGSDVFVFGGCAETGATNDLWKLDTETWNWELVQTTGPIPCARMGHAACVSGNTMYIHGGFTDYCTVYSDICFINLSTFEWTSLSPVPPLPKCFSHSMTCIGSTLLLVGGCPNIPVNKITAFDTVNLERTTLSTIGVGAREFIPVRHAAVEAEGKLWVLGGGAFCFSFGSVFSVPCCLDLSGELWKAGVDLPHKGVELAQEGVEQGGDVNWGFVTPKKMTKQVKDTLKAHGWLDVTLKSKTMDDRIALPVSSEGATCLNAAIQSTMGHMYDNQNNSTGLPSALSEAVASGSTIQQFKFDKSKRKQTVSPHVALRKCVRNLLGKRGLRDGEVEALLCELPTKWEKLGDLVLIPENAMKSDAWNEYGLEIWEGLARELGAARVARQAPIASTGTRDSQAVLMLGNDGWVEHKENGVVYSLDVTKCMFSSGNVTERTRMGKLRCQKETIVDLYTGIGYYTLPLLRKSGAKKVYACEWNPNAIEALCRNLSNNGVADRCCVLQGDCREVAPVEVADRVMLGLLPSSEGGWETAVKALKPTGGWLHVHCNVRDKLEKSWTEDTLQNFHQAAVQAGRNWDMQIKHVERVKWYAPHVRHIVLDIHCQPKSEMSESDGNTEEFLAGKSVRMEASRKVEKCDFERKSVPEVFGVSKEAFDAKIFPRQEPVVMKGLNVGPCCDKWTSDYLISHPESESTLVSAHAYDDQQGLLDFVHKNFSFETMTLRELVMHCSEKSSTPSSKHYYLRSIGKNPRKEPSRISEMFPELSKDVVVPDIVPENAFFSSVLRISSPGVRLWTHFDVMDNVLVQVRGTKRIRLWPPHEIDNLYIKGSSSEVVNIDNPDNVKFPKFKNAQYVECTLHPGDVLFIPALWFHNVLAEDFSISVNNFWYGLDKRFYDKRDLYGNRDLLPVQAAEKLLDEAGRKLEELPEPYRGFYYKRLIDQFSHVISS